MMDTFNPVVPSHQSACKQTLVPGGGLISVVGAEGVEGSEDLRAVLGPHSPSAPASTRRATVVGQ